MFAVGLFDEYLKEQPVECDSAVITSAQLQYQAAVGLPNRKVSATLRITVI